MKSIKEFAFKEVLVSFIEDKTAQFTNSSSNNGKEIVEVEILAIGEGTSKFYKAGDRVLVHKEMLIERKHKYFYPNEMMLDNEQQIICRISCQ